MNVKRYKDSRRCPHCGHRQSIQTCMPYLIHAYGYAIKCEKCGCDLVPDYYPIPFPVGFFYRIRNRRRRRQLLPLYSALVITNVGSSVDGGSVDSSPFSVLHSPPEDHIQEIVTPKLRISAAVRLSLRPFVPFTDWRGVRGRWSGRRKRGRCREDRGRRSPRGCRSRGRCG